MKVSIFLRCRQNPCLEKQDLELQAAQYKTEMQIKAAQYKTEMQIKAAPMSEAHLYQLISSCLS
jgi:hypothetical protein